MHLLDHVAPWNFFRRLIELPFQMRGKTEANLREFGIDRTMSILDVGCGAGQYARLTDAEYLGIDCNPRYIASARARYGTARRQFRCARLQDVDFSGQRYDVALLVDVTHHLADDDLRSLLAALAKATGRYLAVFDPVRQRPGNWLGRVLTALDRGRFIRAKARELELLAEHFDLLRVKDVQQFFTQEGIAVLAQPKETAHATGPVAPTP